MKIRGIETMPVDRYLFVRVHTDEGISGLGELGVWGYLEASERVVQTFKRYLIGQDLSALSTTGNTSTAGATSGGQPSWVR